MVKLEKEQGELISLYNKMSEELMHLKSLEKREKEREKQISQIKARISSNGKEISEIQNGLKFCDSVFKEFVKKMERGGLTQDEKKNLERQIQSFLNENKLGEEDLSEEVTINELFDLLPRTEKLLKRLENNLKP